MNLAGARDLLVQARSALLDALEALSEHQDAVVLIGAQAIYLHTGRADVALAEATKDSDLALDTRHLADDPRIEQAMSAAGFTQDVSGRQPGAWLNPAGIPVDLMVPEALAGAAASQRRGARIPPHANTAARRAVGLEAAVVDHAPMRVAALAQGDTRSCTVEVAGPAALLVAKLHKLAERRDNPRRLEDKDAHDVYRLFVAVPTDALATTLQRLLADPLAGAVTEQAMADLQEMFAAGPEALGSAMAGRAEVGVGHPDTVAASVAVLAGDLLLALDSLSR
jgi:hypothetical protein